MYRSIGRFVGSTVVVLAAAYGAYLFAQEQTQSNQNSPAKQPKATKGPGTPVVNMREMPQDVNLEIMEVLRVSLGVECSYCHVSGSRLEKGHVGDRQNDDAPHKLIARDMIRMTKEINEALTGTGVFPNEKNIVTCWTCHRGHPVPPTGPPAIAATQTAQ